MGTGELGLWTTQLFLPQGQPEGQGMAVIFPTDLTLQTSTSI